MVANTNQNERGSPIRARANSPANARKNLASVDTPSQDENMSVRPAKYGAAWSRDELILTFELYCRIPFRATRASNPKVQRLAILLHRSPADVASKGATLVNASLRAAMLPAVWLPMLRRDLECCVEQS